MFNYIPPNPYDTYSDEPVERPSRTIGRCCECDSAIQTGDEYIDIDGDLYCEYCVDDFSKRALLEKVGYPLQVADID